MSVARLEIRGWQFACTIWTRRITSDAFTCRSGARLIGWAEYEPRLWRSFFRIWQLAASVCGSTSTKSQ